MNWKVALELGRVSNLPTVWTNTIAGVALAGTSPADSRVPWLLLALSLCYVAGMFLNDAFDREFADLSGRLILPPGSGFKTRDDSWSGFFNVWQYLSVEGAGSGPIDVNNGRTDREGFGLFARAGFADAGTNPIEWTVSGGIGAKGLFEGREHDTLGIGYAHSETSSLPILASFVLNDTANRFEAFYDLALTPGAELTFDVQVADSLVKSQNTATLLGVRLRLQF